MHVTRLLFCNFMIVYNILREMKRFFHNLFPVFGDNDHNAEEESGRMKGEKWKLVFLD